MDIEGNSSAEKQNETIDLDSPEEQMEITQKNNERNSFLSNNISLSSISDKSDKSEFSYDKNIEDCLKKIADNIINNNRKENVKDNSIGKLLLNNWDSGISTNNTDGNNYFYNNNEVKGFKLMNKKTKRK